MEKIDLGSMVSAKKAAHKLAEEKTGKKRAAMAQHQFVGAIVRMAHLRYASSHYGLGAALDKLLHDVIEPHVSNELQLEHDPFSVVMGGRLMKVVLHKHEARLRKVFAFFAALDVSLAGLSGKAQNTMNIKETADLFEALELFDTRYGVREMIAAFVRVNIDDELYEQEEAGNVASELVFDEFCEVIARLFWRREWERREGRPSGADQFDGVEVAFHRWLVDDFLPRAAANIAARKKAPSRRKTL